jgi:hypothetical protein
MKFTCAKCGVEHDVEEVSFGADRPLQWDLLTDEEKADSELSEELCVIQSRDGNHFFIRGCLEIPIRETDRTFTWGVWASLSEKSFLEITRTWEDPDRVRYGPYFGWLCTKLPGYPDTMFLKTRVHVREVGVRPMIELEPSDHPLSLQQRFGIPKEELQSVVMMLLHQEPPRTEGSSH